MLDDLNRKLGVDLVANLQKFRAVRAGFVASGISRFNHMIERHELGTWPGYTAKRADGDHDMELEGACLVLLRLE